MTEKKEMSSNQERLIALHFQEAFEGYLAAVLSRWFVADAELSLQKEFQDTREQIGPFGSSYETQGAQLAEMEGERWLEMLEAFLPKPLE